MILEPQTEIDDLVQIFGRSGRMTPQGIQTKCVCYLVYNSSDISDNKPGMTDDVRNYCKNSTICRKHMGQCHQGVHLDTKYVPQMRLEKSVFDPF